MEIPANLKQDTEAGHCFDRVDYLWAAQYQQNLTPVESNMIKAAWLRVAPEELMGQQREIIVPVVPCVRLRRTVRERNGLIELPQRSGLKPGDQVRILQGPFAGRLGLYAGMRAYERVLVLLALLGGQQRVELAKDAIEAVHRD